jgi:peptide/nickel transport system substrate-binding protein
MKGAHARRAWTLAALLLVVAGTNGCGHKSDGVETAYHDPHPLPIDTLAMPTAEIGRYGGRFVIAQTADPRTFNPMMSNEQTSNDINDRMYAGLTEYDQATQTIYPLLAKRWDVSADGLTWTWHLRRGARFSDGQPITAADVLFAFEVVYDPTLHPSVQDLLKIHGKPLEVTAPDSYTVVTKSAGPHALMAAAVGAVRIVPRHRLEAAFRSGTFASAYNVSTPPESIVTSGAWRVRHYVPGEKVVLSRNPYWLGVDSQGRRLPYLDEMIYLIVPDQNTAALKFQAGEIDALDNVKPEDYKSYIDRSQSGNFTLYDLGPSLNSNFFFFNLNRLREAKSGGRVGEPYVGAVKYRWFSDRDFRRAVSMAIDRDAIIRGPFYGEAIKNWSSFTAGSKQWHTPHVTGYDYNPDEAKRVLDRLGWKDGNGDGVREDARGNPLQFTIKTNSDNAVRLAMMNFIRDDLAKIGIRCIATPVEINTLVSNVRQDFQYDAMLLGLTSGVPADPGMSANVYRSSGLTHYWNIKQPRPETAAEAEIDRWFAENLSATDDSTRHRTWEAIAKRMNEECFFIWLPTQKMKVPVRNGFGNVHPTVVPHRILWNIERVFSKASRARV